MREGCLVRISHSEAKSLLELIGRRKAKNLKAVADRLTEWIIKAEQPDDLLERARDEYANDECEIDDDAAISETDDGDWVQAWLWVAYPEDEE